jgi:NAD(P)-dependent dehydrogenase (short-subunit alcohol dehydrogenase family)
MGSDGRPLRLARAGYDVAINHSRSEENATRTLDELASLCANHRALRADVSDAAAVACVAPRLVHSR